MKALLILVSMMTMIGAQASIICSTPRMSKAFEIKDEKITFIESNSKESSRRIASINMIRTKYNGSGFTKILNFEGQKHTIHISDKNKFSELEDYLLIKSRKGHEMTYPLTCKKF